MLTTLLSASVQTMPAAGNLQTAAFVAEIVVALAMLVLAVFGIVLFAKANLVLNEFRRSARQNFGPVSDRARSITDNVEYISQAVRTDVQGLHDSVQALTGRLNHASERMEERIEDFNALMEVVQGEAESLFLDAASTARGVREGARAISDRVAGDEEREDTGGESQSLGAAEVDAAEVDAVEADTAGA